jgi:hypothetical protein
LFQVSNQGCCIKVANDFLFPDHLEHCLQLTNEFREENLIDGPWMVDVLQLKRSVLHAYMNIQEQCLGLAASEGSGMLPATDVENSAFMPLHFFIVGAVPYLPKPRPFNTGRPRGRTYGCKHRHTSGYPTKQYFESRGQLAYAVILRLKFLIYNLACIFWRCHQPADQGREEQSDP